MLKFVIPPSWTKRPYDSGNPSHVEMQPDVISRVWGPNKEQLVVVVYVLLGILLVIRFIN